MYMYIVHTYYMYMIGTNLKNYCITGPYCVIELKNLANVTSGS